MIGHAEIQAPLRIATGAEIVVALLRAHDADIALRQFLEAGIAVTLAEALVGLAPAMGAVDGAQVFQPQRPADQRIDRHQPFTEAKGVLHRHARLELNRHLLQRAASELQHQWRVPEAGANRLVSMAASAFLLLEPHSWPPM